MIRKGSKWIDLEVMMCHPDAGDLPEDPAFALLLLTSEAYCFGFPKNLGSAGRGR